MRLQALEPGGDGQRLAGLHAEGLHVQCLQPGYYDVELERHVQQLRLFNRHHGRLRQYVPVLVHGAAKQRCGGPSDCTARRSMGSNHCVASAPPRSMTCMIFCLHMAFRTDWLLGAAAAPAMCRSWQRSRKCRHTGATGPWGLRGAGAEAGAREQCGYLFLR